ncbi:MAG: tetratricopeptide repeat protein [Abditibacteriaceae bacterium]
MEPRGWRRWAAPVRMVNTIIVLAFVLVIAVVLLAAFRPNRGANLFEKAQRLEAVGQWNQALGHYRLLVETEPNSSYAPRALMQEASILEGMARQSGNHLYFQQAVDVYRQVSLRYPNNTVAGQALLQSGNLSSTDLNDYVQATKLYQDVLTKYQYNGDYVSQAALALGRVALVQRNAPLAEKYFGQVLDKFAAYPDRCAEAQYQTGVVAETLTRQPENAKAAYQLTIKNYPTTVWATNAKARLGMLFYGDIASGGSARRLITRLTPLPDIGYDRKSPFLPLALVLSVRGLEIGPATLNAWSLQPFFCGFDPDNPGRVLQFSQAFENAVANAGLSFTVQNETDAKKAFSALREAVDRGHTPVIFIGKWELVTGYDTVAQTVFLQEKGAQVTNLPIKRLLMIWGKSKPVLTITHSKPFTFLSFQAASDNPKVTAENVDQSDKNGVRLLMTPSFTLTLASLPRKNAQQRTIHRAAVLLSRAHFGNALLNVEALNQLAKDLSDWATLPPSPVPVPEADSSMASPASPVDWQQRLKHAAHVAPWFDKPLQQWIESRRDAASYLEDVSRETGNTNLEDAATALRHSIMALQNASSNFPEGLKDNSTTLWTTSLAHQLQRVSQDLLEAKNAEANAAKLMQGNS